VRSILVTVLFAGVAGAQVAQPSVTPFPLEIKRTPSSFSKKDGEELKKEFVRLTRKLSLVPDNASLESALAELKRQDCDREDECLKQLAQKGSTLYAMFADVEFTITGQVVATGRVIRDDGKLMGGPSKITMVKGKDSFKDMAKVALVRLLEELKVSALPAYRAVEKTPDVPVVVAPPVEKRPDLVPPPLPLPEVKHTEVRSHAKERTGGWIVAGVGAAAVVVGLIVVETSGNPTTAPLPREQVVAKAGQQTAGVAVMIAGGVVAAGGLIWGLMKKDEVVTTAIVPQADGASLVVGGRF
jgi:hypothetical protein